MRVLSTERLLPAAEQAAYLLRAALRDALDADGQKTFVAAAVERLWIDTETEFFELLAAADARLSGFAEEADHDEVWSVELGDLNRRWLERALRPAATGTFNATAPVDRLADLDATQVKRIVDAAKFLRLALLGYGPLGKKLSQALDLPPPESKTSTRKSEPSEEAAA